MEKAKSLSFTGNSICKEQIDLRFRMILIRLNRIESLINKSDTEKTKPKKKKKKTGPRGPSISKRTQGIYAAPLK